jgi:hypothetical protein
MKHLVGFKIYQEDKLVIRWTNCARNLGEVKNYFQGKRIPKAQYERYPWARKMIRIYVEKGTIEAIKFIKVQIPIIGLKDAKDLLDSFRGERRD